MKGVSFFAILTAVLGLCCTSETNYIDSVDDLIAKRSPYQYPYAFKRFREYGYKIDSIGVFNPDYEMVHVQAGYDSLTRLVTSISYLYFKHRGGVLDRSDQIDFDESGKILRIHILTYGHVQSKNQRYAFYYFKGDSIVRKETRKIEIIDLPKYLKNVEFYKAYLSKQLIERGEID